MYSFIPRAILATAALTQTTYAIAPEPPSPPSLDFLYTAYVHCLPTLYQSQGPAGIRHAIPIVSGNFTGPKLKGEILDLGADWGLTDPRTGIFSADTRYNLRTHDGANLFLRTSGPTVPGGGLHLRVVIETGDPKYYWLNNVVAVGVLQTLYADEETLDLRIDVWHLAGEFTNTTFLDGTVAQWRVRGGEWSAMQTVAES